MSTFHQLFAGNTCLAEKSSSNTTPAPEGGGVVGELPGGGDVLSAQLGAATTTAHAKAASTREGSRIDGGRGSA